MKYISNLPILNIVDSQEIIHSHKTPGASSVTRATKPNLHFLTACKVERKTRCKTPLPPTPPKLSKEPAQKQTYFPDHSVQ